MGMIHSKTVVYWYGLTTDETDAFDYGEFENFINDKVFDGKSLAEIWKDVDIIEIDGYNPIEKNEKM